MTGSALSPAPPPAARQGLGRGALVLLIFGLIGLLMLAGGVYLVVRNFTVVLREPTTTGTIVRLETYEDRTDNDNSSSSTTRFRPIYQYRVGGKNYEISGSGAKDYNYYKVGQTLPVRYDPEHPNQAQFDTFQGLWLAPLALLIMAIPFSFIGWAGISPRRAQPSAQPAPSAPAAS